MAHERLTASFSWLAGQVVNEYSGEGNTSIFKINPFNESPQLVVKDLRKDPLVYSFDGYKKANFPFSILDENLITPRNTLHLRPEIKPVILLQASFITSGLLLIFVAQYNTMDMTSQGHIIQFFPKACHNKQFTGKELAASIRTNKNLIPLLNVSYKQGPELISQAIKPIPTQPLIDTSVQETPLPPNILGPT